MILVNGRDKVAWKPGMTVADALAAQNWDYALIVVTVNGTFVPSDDYATFPVPDGADLKAIHIAHGG